MSKIITKRTLDILNPDLINYKEIEVKIVQDDSEQGAIIYINNDIILDSDQLTSLSDLVSYLIK